MIRFLLICLTLLLTTPACWAWFPHLPAEANNPQPPQQLLGRNLDYLPAPGETLMEIARRAGIGFDNLLQANPGVDPWHLRIGQRLLLPKQTLLPAGITTGITVNLAELRLYLVWDEDGRRRVRIYPVGIGREGWQTPLGDYRVETIVDRPSWTPPASLRAEKPDLPGTVPPGPDNPLGDYWIGLSAPGVGLHGTNQPYGVGRRVSHGCMRLYPEDIQDLASRVRPGLPVRIIDQPVKVALAGDQLWVEAHRSVGDQQLLSIWPVGARTRIQQIIREARGIPEEVPLTGRSDK